MGKKNKANNKSTESASDIIDANRFAPLSKKSDNSQRPQWTKNKAHTKKKTVVSQKISQTQKTTNPISPTSSQASDDSSKPGLSDSDSTASSSPITSPTNSTDGALNLSNIDLTGSFFEAVFSDIITLSTKDQVNELNKLSQAIMTSNTAKEPAAIQALQTALTYTTNEFDTYSDEMHTENETQEEKLRLQKERIKVLFNAIHAINTEDKKQLQTAINREYTLSLHNIESHEGGYQAAHEQKYRVRSNSYLFPRERFLADEHLSLLKEGVARTEEQKALLPQTHQSVMPSQQAKTSPSPAAPKEEVKQASKPTTSKFKVTYTSKSVENRSLSLQRLELSITHCTQQLETLKNIPGNNALNEWKNKFSKKYQSHFDALQTLKNNLKPDHNFSDDCDKKISEIVATNELLLTSKPMRNWPSKPSSNPLKQLALRARDYIVKNKLFFTSLALGIVGVSLCATGLGAAAGLPMILGLSGKVFMLATGAVLTTPSVMAGCAKMADFDVLKKPALTSATSEKAYKEHVAAIESLKNRHNTFTDHATTNREKSADNDETQQSSESSTPRPGKR